MKQKSTTIIICLMLMHVTGIAQFKKNAVLLGGDISYAQQKNEYNTGSHGSAANIGLTLGKFIATTKVAGILVRYGFNTQRYNSNDSVYSKSKAYNFGFFYRQYKPLGKGFYFFGQADAAYAYSLQEYTQSTSVSKSVNVSFAPGISYQVFSKLQMELTLPDMVYSSVGTNNYIVKNDPTSGYKSTSFSIGSRLIGSTPLSNLGIGIRLIL